MPSSSLLSDFEWDDGLAMPVANAQNKFLEEQVSGFYCYCENGAENVWQRSEGLPGTCSGMLDIIYGLRPKFNV